MSHFLSVFADSGKSQLSHQIKGGGPKDLRQDVFPLEKSRTV